MECVDANLAVDFVDGRVEAEARARIEAHVAACDECRVLMAELARGPSLPGVDRDAEALAAGTHMGRYRIEDYLGRGGMGVVYRAFDPELQRPVALKQLHIAADGSSMPADEARQRLLREARALAKLNHPNVVAVHDVGTFGDDVYIAMELVEGDTLRSWMVGADRDRAEILGALIAAGRGLAAAHRAGMVHRDFKPDNVLVGDDGRVRVLDFGLVRSAGERGARTIPSDTVGLEELTRTGVVVGTPAYMAPEQHRGETADPRSDQFSFCVTAYQALYGERPFAGESAKALERAIAEGALRPAPDGSSVPAHLRAALARGMSSEPGDRFASMDELLAELERDPSARVRRAAVVAGMVALLVIAGLGVWLGTRTNSEVCTNSERYLRGVWDEDTRATVTRAFPDSRLTTLLDGYASQWQRAHRQACRDTRVHKSQSERVLDLRMRCLENRRLSLAALVNRVGETASAAVRGKAIDAALRLPRIGSCSEVAALERGDTLPDDPQARSRAIELNGRIAAARRRLDLGEVDAGLVDAKDIEKDARALGHPPVHAAALALTGNFHSSAGDYARAERDLRRAIEVGARARADDIIAESWTRLIFVIAQAGRFSEAVALEAVASAAITRAGSDALLRMAALRHLGEAYSWELDYPKAIDRLAKSVALGRGGDARRQRELSVSLVSQAEILNENGDSAEALVAIDQALTIQRELLGAEHRELSWSLVVRAKVLWGVGKTARAEVELRAALALMNRIAPDHPALGYAYRELGNIHVQRERLAEAEAAYRRSVRIAENSYGKDDFRVSLRLEDMASVIRARGDAARALPMYERVLRIRRATRGTQHLSVGHALQALAVTLFRLKRHERAMGHLREAIAIYEPLGHTEGLGAATGRLAVVMAALGKSRGEVLATARRAEALLEKAKDSEGLAQLRRRFPALTKK